MICKIRKWLLSDAEDLTVAISNKKVQDNLRDGIPYGVTFLRCRRKTCCGRHVFIDFLVWDMV